MLQLQLFLEPNLSLMQPAEFVDLVLILSSHLNLVAAGCSLVFLGELDNRLASTKADAITLNP
jgi:hypothetical protein